MMVSCCAGATVMVKRIQLEYAFSGYRLNIRRKLHRRMNLGNFIARRIETRIDHLEIRPGQQHGIGNYVNRHFFRPVCGIRL
jgi:hypothetical protein